MQRGALDAALAVEQDQVGDGDRLLEVALLLDEPALARSVGQGLVLQRALAALVAHGAVERVVGEQELEHPVLGLLHLVRRGVDHHALGRLNEAGRLERRPAGTVDLDQAHPAHADGRHARVVAEAGDVGAGPIRRRDEQFPLARGHAAAVEGEAERLLARRVSGGRVSQRGTPLP